MFMQQMPSRNGQHHLQLIRVKAGQKVAGLICGEPVRTYVHYHKGKSLPCISELSDICPMCETGFPRRYYAYYPLRNPEGKTAFIELTQTAEEIMQDHLADTPPNTIPQIVVSRKVGKRNNPLTIDVKTHEVDAEKFAAWLEKLTPVEEIIRTLLILWDLPKQREGEEDNEYGDRLAAILMERVI
jgi:hypothetical protein